jgi:hypothetical protein
VLNIGTYISFHFSEKLAKLEVFFYLGADEFGVAFYNRNVAEFGFQEL